MKINAPLLQELGKNVLTSYNEIVKINKDVKRTSERVASEVWIGGGSKEYIQNIQKYDETFRLMEEVMSTLGSIMRNHGVRTEEMIAHLKSINF